MADVRPFRALRYNTDDPLSLALVTAPPYDCISPEERDELYRTHPHNVVRLILGKDEPGDDDIRNRYTRAADFIEKWKRAGILVRDADPSLYLYQQEFHVEGRPYLREGVLARVGLEEFGTGKVFPHEETMDGPFRDRLRLLRTVQANLSPIFSLYPDPENLVPDLFHEVVHGEPLAQTVDSDGVVHRLFASSDPGLADRVAEAVADAPMYIADGHHRYEVAQAYRRQVQEQGEDVGPDHPAGSVLMLCVSMHHPGLAVLPTHRVLRGLPGLQADRLREVSRRHFDWQELEGAEATSPRLIERLQQAPAHSMGLWTRDTSKAFLLTLKRLDVMERLAPEKSKAWRRLDVAILERVLLGEDLPGAVDDTGGLERQYVHLAQQAFDAVHEDGADAAVLLKPLPVQSLEDVARTGERMPPKSTYFYPKALSGLVMNPLD
jgi:uncharacterized protein (DUF1015 family)